MLKASDSVREIPELNAAQKRAIKSYGALTVGDLLDMLPRRYDDYSRTVSIGDAPVGQPVTLKVKVESIGKQPGFRRRITMVRASMKDDSGSLRVIWFNQPWLLEKLPAGKEIFLSGTIQFRPKFGRQMSNPIWEPIDSEGVTSGTVAPVYPLTGSVAQKTMRELMAHVIEDLEDVPDHLPQNIREAYNLLNRTDAYKAMHRPRTMGIAEEGRRRLAFDELLMYRLALGTARHEADEAGAPKVSFDERFAKQFVASLPFPLTDDQRKAAWATILDMQKERPMRRLLQGDVGSGKTVVAAFLMSLVYRAGGSAVLMAPTEILAKQHGFTIRRFVEETEQAPVMLLTSNDKRLWEGGEEITLKLHEARERIQKGRVLVIGTHALLERAMLPPDTALAVVDEQHRFGVAQREALAVAPRPDGLVPHLLSMTATPIPRSLALTLYGDLDVSLIRQKPKGRQEVKTKVLTGADREQAYAAVVAEVKKGHRAFVVCPLIEESDKLGVKSVTEEAKRLAAGPLKGLRIGLLHGRMSPADKDGVMQSFSEGLLDVLIATTVVEVGVDVPEATVMLIEGAERFGLAQLHQLRGRVGRSSRASFCCLLSDADGPALERLKVLERTNDGFIVAEEDMKRRGEGNVLGTAQSGQAVFRAARSYDYDLMAMAGKTADSLLSEDGELRQVPELRALAEHIRKTSHQE